MNNQLEQAAAAASGDGPNPIRGRLVMKHGISSSRQAISQHLEVLEAAGLVKVVREGRYKFHWFNGEPLEAIAKRWPAKGQRKEK